MQSYVLDAEKWDNPNNAEEACRGVLRRWLLHAPGTGETERTWHSVLEALETSGHSHLAGQLKREHFVDSSEGPISPLSQTVTSAGKSWDSTTLTAAYYVTIYVIVPFLQNETKTERPFPLYETPHQFRQNEWTVF